MPETAKSNTNLPIDFTSVLDRIGGDATFLQDLLELYFREFAEKQRLLEDALAQNDSTRIQEVGHSLKGASANLSLTPLQKLGLTIETAGREKDLDKAREAISALADEFERLKTFLKMNPLGESA